MIASIKRRFTAEQLAAKGLTDEKLMQMYNVNPSAAAAYKPVAPVSTAMSGSGERLSIQAVKAAFAELYLHGNRKELFLLATSQNYLTVINDVVLATEKQKDERKDLLNYAIYANPTEMSTHIAKNASANICYVLPHSTETRLYDYTSDEANAWWNELRQKMN